MRYINYETGDVPAHMRDVPQKCPDCGATWVGPAGGLCGRCLEDKRKALQEIEGFQIAAPSYGVLLISEIPT